MRILLQFVNAFARLWYSMNNQYNFIKKQIDRLDTSRLRLMMDGH